MLVLGKNFQILTVMVNHGGNSGKRVHLCKIIINILNTYICLQYELRYTSHQFTTCNTTCNGSMRNENKS